MPIMKIKLLFHQTIPLPRHLYKFGDQKTFVKSGLFVLDSTVQFWLNRIHKWLVNSLNFSMNYRILIKWYVIHWVNIPINRDRDRIVKETKKWKTLMIMIDINWINWVKLYRKLCRDWMLLVVKSTHQNHLGG